MYLADYHVHSTCSQDGRQTMAQAAQAAVDAGLDELCLTDHVDTVYWGPEQKPRWDFDWDAVRRQFRQAQEQWGHRITLRLGAELGEAAMSFQRIDPANIDFFRPAGILLMDAVHVSAGSRRQRGHRPCQQNFKYDFHSLKSFISGEPYYHRTC